MEKELIENRLINVLEKIKKRKIFFTYYGIIDICFVLKKIVYDLEDGILNIKDKNKKNIQLDIDDVYEIYVEQSNNKYINLKLIMSNNTRLEIKAKEKRKGSFFWK